MRGQVLCVLLTLFSITASADDESPFGLSYVETKDLTLVYFDSLSYLVPHSVRTFTNSLTWQRDRFNWAATERTGVLLKDWPDYGTAVTWPAPQSTVFLDIAPLSLVFETFPASERMYSLMNHELVHVATNNVATEQDRRWRRLFGGKVAPQSQNPESLLYTYLTVPRFTAPRWYGEGGAVFMETWMAGGIGRAQGGYDEMVFRAMVRDGARFYDPLGLVSRGILVDFQVGANAYLYGTRFFTYLAYVHSPDKVVEWLRRDEGSQRYYADQFRQVFGMSVEAAWQEWIAFEREFQLRNLARVKENPVTPYRVLPGAAMGSISRTYYDEASETLYGAFRTAGVVEHVGALNTRDGTHRNVADIKRAMLYRVASFAFDPGSGTAFYTNDNLAQRDLMALNVATGEPRMLLENARIGEIAFNAADRSLIGVRHANGIASLVRIPFPYREWITLHEFAYGVIPSDLDISPDGQRLSASVTEANADQFVRVWELSRITSGDLRPLSEFRFGQSVPESFVFSRDGRYLYGSSYYTGVSNIFRYEVASGTVEALTNAEVGFFRPTELSDGRMMVLAYTDAGFVPAIIDPKPITDVSAIKFLGSELVARHPVVTAWQVPAPASVNPDDLITGHGRYHPLHHMGLVNAYPVLQGYKDLAGVGYRFNFEDPIRFATGSIAVAWTPGASDLPGDQTAHIDARATYLGWRAGLAWNPSDFYDLFGPTKRSRKGYSARLGYDHLLIYDEPRKLELSMDFAHFGKIDTLPNAQNVSATSDRLTTGALKLNYTDVRRSLGAVDDEKGVLASAGLALNRAGDQGSALMRAGIDLGMALPLAHSSLWSRSWIGLAHGDRDDPVANFYFGGFGNNYVDSGTVQRYREPASMPGFEIDELGAQRYVKQMVEWTLPPLIFESVGTPGFHLTWARPAVFATALWTDAGGNSRERTAGNLGAQVDLRLSTMHWYEMMLSVGYARGYERGRKAGNEWMLSLKVL